MMKKKEETRTNLVFSFKAASLAAPTDLVNDDALRDNPPARLPRAALAAGAPIVGTDFLAALIDEIRGARVVVVPDAEPFASAVDAVAAEILAARADDAVTPVEEDDEAVGGGREARMGAGEDDEGAGTVRSLDVAVAAVEVDAAFDTRVVEAAGAEATDSRAARAVEEDRIAFEVMAGTIGRRADADDANATGFLARAAAAARARAVVGATALTGA